MTAREGSLEAVTVAIKSEGLTEDESAALKQRFKAYFRRHGYPNNNIALIAEPELQSLADENPGEWAEACEEWELYGSDDPALND